MITFKHFEILLDDNIYHMSISRSSEVLMNCEFLRKSKVEYFTKDSAPKLINQPKKKTHFNSYFALELCSHVIILSLPYFFKASLCQASLALFEQVYLASL